MENEQINVEFRNYDEHYSRMQNRRPSESLDSSVIDTYFPPWLKTDQNDIEILDIGCGYGHQLALLSKWGFTRLNGIEMSVSSHSIAVKELQGLAKLELVDAFDYLPKKKQGFDLIILNDVLEHIPRDSILRLLYLAHDALRANGRIVIRVPNMSSILAQYAMYIDFTHVVGFTEFSLVQVLELTGFRGHQVVTNSASINFKAWRPWRPFKGLGLRKALNVFLHKLLYEIREQSPKPTVYDYNLTVWSEKVAK